MTNLYSTEALNELITEKLKIEKYFLEESKVRVAVNGCKDQEKGFESKQIFK